jgi:hypothetical protein
MFFKVCSSIKLFVYFQAKKKKSSIYESDYYGSDGDNGRKYSLQHYPSEQMLMKHQQVS